MSKCGFDSLPRTRSAFQRHGFGLWSEWDGARVLMLVPAVLRDWIPDGTPVVSISGKESTIDDVDMDTRGGFLAWGFVVIDDLADLPGREAVLRDVRRAVERSMPDRAEYLLTAIEKGWAK